VEAEKAEQARVEAEKAEQACVEAEEAEKARVEAEKAEQLRVEAEKVEQARVEVEQARVEAEEAACVEAEEAETARVEAEEGVCNEGWATPMAAPPISLLHANGVARADSDRIIIPPTEASHYDSGDMQSTETAHQGEETRFDAASGHTFGAITRDELLTVISEALACQADNHREVIEGLMAKHQSELKAVTVRLNVLEKLVQEHGWKGIMTNSDIATSCDTAGRPASEGPEVA